MIRVAESGAELRIFYECLDCVKRISQSHIDNAVRKCLKQYFYEYLEYERQHMQSGGRGRDDRQTKKRLAELSKMKIGYYEAFHAGEINKEEYFERKQAIDAEKAKLLQQSQGDGGDSNTASATVEMPLTRELVETYVDKVLINATDVITVLMKSGEKYEC